MGICGEDGALFRRLAAALLAGALFAVYFAASSSADGPTVESGTGPGGFLWKPSTATIGVGGTVGFKNGSAVVPHGLKWTGGPATPSCAGVPVNGEDVSWNGSCSFAQAGTYSFVCTVHPTEMKGTITVTSGEVPPPEEHQTESPLRGSASQALKLARSQRGKSVRGSIALSPAAVGGRLEVTLLAPRSALPGGPGGYGKATVGHLARTGLSSGRASFAVRLKGAARRALESREKLSLSVQIVVAPPGQAALTLKRGVVLHA